MLRRQAIRPLRSPLIVMTPKSLLRHKEAISQLDELAEGAFQTVIDETDGLDPVVVEIVQTEGFGPIHIKAKSE